LDLDVGMLPGDRNVSDPDFALMPSAQFDSPLRSVLDHHDAFLLLTGSLEDQVGPLRPVKGYQLLIVDLAVFSLHLDVARQLAFADFALEFSKVVVLSAPDNLLLHLHPNPLCQAAVVHSPTGAMALAGVEEEVIVGFKVIQANFASIFVLSGQRLALEDVIVEVRTSS